MQNLPRFNFYSDLQRHIATLFDQQCSDQTLPQEAFWDNLHTSWLDRLHPDTNANIFKTKAEAFIDGLRHNFSKMGLLTSEYLIDGTWVPIAQAPAARLRGADCRIVWKKTGIVWGVIPYSQYPLADTPKSKLTLEKAPL